MHPSYVRWPSWVSIEDSMHRWLKWLFWVIWEYWEKFGNRLVKNTMSKQCYDRKWAS